jgi:hypothetical protein
LPIEMKNICALVITASIDRVAAISFAALGDESRWVNRRIGH